jgi:hypothetical protein
MAASNHNQTQPTIDSDTAEAMTKFGITRVPVDYFHYKEFRYTNLEDAFAQATRDNGRARVPAPR